MPNDDHWPAVWTSVDKFAAVEDIAILNEMELTVYSRQRGLYPAQHQDWRHDCKQANDWGLTQTRRLQETRKADQH